MIKCLNIHTHISVVCADESKAILKNLCKNIKGIIFYRFSLICLLIRYYVEWSVICSSGNFYVFYFRLEFIYTHEWNLSARVYLDELGTIKVPLIYHLLINIIKRYMMNLTHLLWMILWNFVVSIFSFIIILKSE